MDDAFGCRVSLGEGLWGSVDDGSFACCSGEPGQVSRAKVRDFCKPGPIGKGLEKDIWSTKISVDDWFVTVVEVVEAVGHIFEDWEIVGVCETSLFIALSEVEVTDFGDDHWRGMESE